MTKSMVLRFAGLALLTIGVSSVALANYGPEIDAATGANALALLTGALLIIRGRKR